MTSPKTPSSPKTPEDDTLIAYRLDADPTSNVASPGLLNSDDPVALQSVVLAERFALLSVVAQGGMGTIHKARDLLTGAPVALKQIRTEHVDSHRFVRESLVLAQLSHPSIVRYIAHGISTHGTAYLVMEWLEGDDLSVHLRRGPLPVATTATLIAQVADALAAAHRKGIVHRDLKPSNIMLLFDPELRAKLIDFGIARVAEKGAQPLTATGSIIGTPGYMSPEQVAGDRTIGPQSDVFSLGCVLYECLTATAPFSAGSVHAILAGIMLDTPAPVCTVNPEIPTALGALIDQMIAKDPMQRPQGMDSVVAGLRPHGAEELSLELVRDLAKVPATLTLSNTERKLSCAVGVKLHSAQDHTAMMTSDSALATLRAIAQRFAAALGTAGDCYVLTQALGGPLVDQAARAARMALAIQAEIVDSRVTICTGRSGGGPNEHNSVVSRLVATLASTELMQFTEPTAKILLDETVGSLLESGFALHRDATAIWLTGVRTDSNAQRLILGKATPCVGREPELALLDASFKSCIEDDEAKVILLIGSAGAGKSRIRQEFVQRLQQQQAPDEKPVTCWMGRGDMVRAGSPFAILIDSIRNAVGFAPESESSEEQQLWTWVAKHTPLQPQDVERIVTFLGELLGCSLSPARTAQVQAARGDALLLGDQRQRAVQELLLAVTAQGPLLWVLEDLQWADQPTINLLDGVLRAASNRPLLLLVTARPEVDELFSQLWHERSIQRVRVGPLSQKAAEKIVKSVLGSQAKPELIATLVNRATGHPLHLEELLRASVSRQNEQLPDTALALIEARLEALDPMARRILRAASVFGRTFCRAPLRSMIGASSDHEVEHWLQELTAHEWIRPSSSRSVAAGEPVYELLQDSVQEAAYAMLTEQDRAHGHLVAGRWLERLKDSDPLVLMRHFELGGEPEHATTFALAAARQALGANDFAQAVALCTRVGETMTDGALLGEAYAIAAEAHYCLGSMADAASFAAKAIALVSEQHDAFYGAAAVYVNAFGKLGTLDPVRTMGARLRTLVPSASQWVQFAAAAEAAVVQLAIIGALADAKELLHHARECLMGERAAPMAPSATAAARGHLARAASAVAVFAGDPGAGIPHMQEAVAALEEAGNQRLACSMKKTLGWHLGEYGLLEESERLLRNSVATAERLALQNLAAHARYDLVSPVLRQQKYDEALALVDGACATFRAHNDRRLLSGAYAMRAVVLGKMGRTTDALQSADEAESFAAAGLQRFVVASARAEILAADGRYQAALAATDEGLAALTDGASAEEGVTQLWLARAESFAHLGRTNEARQALRKIYSDLRHRALSIADPTLQAQFNTRIAENARVLALAKEWFADEIDAV